MMVHVQVPPTHPLPLRHHLEQRMRAELEVARAAAEALHGRKQAAHIGFKLRGPGAASALLIEFRPGGYIFGPLHGCIERKVLEEGPKSEPARDLHFLLAHDSQK